MSTPSNPPQYSPGQNENYYLRAIAENTFGGSGAASGQGYVNPATGTVQNYGTTQGGYFAPVSGAQLTNRPVVTSGVRFELSTGASITYYVASTGTAYNASPAYTKTVNVAGTTDEPLSGADTLYVTAVSGTIIARWVQR